jgi:hypothetical protein
LTLLGDIGKDVQQIEQVMKARAADIREELDERVGRSPTRRMKRKDLSWMTDVREGLPRPRSRPDARYAVADDDDVRIQWLARKGYRSRQGRCPRSATVRVEDWPQPDLVRLAEAPARVSDVAGVTACSNNGNNLCSRDNA